MNTEWAVVQYVYSIPMRMHVIHHCHLWRNWVESPHVIPPRKAEILWPRRWRSMSAHTTRLHRTNMNSRVKIVWSTWRMKEKDGSSSSSSGSFIRTRHLIWFQLEDSRTLYGRSGSLTQMQTLSIPTISLKMGKWKWVKRNGNKNRRKQEGEEEETRISHTPEFIFS